MDDVDILSTVGSSSRLTPDHHVPLSSGLIAVLSLSLFNGLVDLKKKERSGHETLLNDAKPRWNQTETEMWLRVTGHPSRNRLAGVRTETI